MKTTEHLPYNETRGSQEQNITLINILGGCALKKHITDFANLSYQAQMSALRSHKRNTPLSLDVVNQLKTHRSNKTIAQRILTYYLIDTFDTSPPLQTSDLRCLWTIGMNNKEVSKDFNHSNFIATMELFLNKLATETMALTDIENACLHAILRYCYHPKNTSHFIHNHFIRQLLCYAKLSRPEDIYINDASFSSRINNIIRNGFLPYARFMTPEALLDIQTTRNTKPVLDFIMAYIRLLPSSKAIVNKNPLYAPKGKVTTKGINQYLSCIFNWLLVFQEAIPGFKFNLTAGVTPTNRSTEQDRAYWPDIIENLFKAILSNRELILDAIQQRVSFHDIEIDTIEALIERLTSIETNPDDGVNIDNRVITGFSKKLFSPNISLGCHLIFDAIASAITKELIRRTKLKRKEELSHYHAYDDEFGNQTKAFNQKVFNDVYNRIQYLVCHSFIHQNVNLSATDLMLFIETTHENRLNLLSASAMEVPEAENGTYNQALPYNLAAIHISPENRNANTRGVVLSIASKKVATIKEILLFTLFFHSLPASDHDRIDLENQFPRLMHHFFFIRELQIQASSFHCSNQEREETHYYIQQVFDSVVKIDALFNAYVRYFLNYSTLSINREEADFLLSNLNKTKSILQANDTLLEVFLPRITPLLPEPQHSETSSFNLFNTTPTKAILSYEEVKNYCIIELSALEHELAQQQNPAWLLFFNNTEKKEAIFSLKISLDVTKDVFELYQKIDEFYRNTHHLWEKLTKILEICMEKIQLSIHGYGRGIQI